ncbi:MAG: deoxyribodipyrimidine photo-lyase [Patescibacteria group bacterium]|nr:deoxyribodipyrimidine photo-lyase [Patescibacteria group bacterium]
MIVHPDRFRLLNQKPAKHGPVLYWMSRDQRVHNNWALLKAQEEAIKRSQPFIVVFSLVSDFLNANPKHFCFMKNGLLKAAKELANYHIPFFLLEGDPRQTIPSIVDDLSAGLVVTDFSPLRIGRTWREDIANRIPCQMIEVDAHNVIPVWITSQKQEIAAYTIRPKIYKFLLQYLTPFPTVKKQPAHGISSTTLPSVSLTDCYDWITPGETYARQALKTFLETRLERYAIHRNDPNEDAQSNLSPYLHFGHICTQEILLFLIEQKKLHIDDLIDPKRNGSATHSNERAFVEELVVRKELAENFCFYNHQYDTCNGFPDWAKKSHEHHANDPREYVYTKEEFELGKTHDPLWNAAQAQMVKTGKMHGYMRMYWAKKILEWTKNPDEAMNIAIYLNDHYSLDGRDPNGYTGISWSIGGVHDRPWFQRPIFGTIRYMSYNGCKQKFDIHTYINKWL